MSVPGFSGFSRFLIQGFLVEPHRLLEIVRAKLGLLGLSKMLGSHRRFPLVLLYGNTYKIGNLTENLMYDVFLPHGLVDQKICTIELV